jgi:hypothetical protein
VKKWIGVLMVVLLALGTLATVMAMNEKNSPEKINSKKEQFIRHVEN